MKYKVIAPIAVTFCFLAQLSFAQISRGDFAVGAQGNYTKQSMYETTGATVSGHYFFANGFSAGLIIPVSHTESGQYGRGSYILDRYSIGPSIRYNWPLTWNLHAIAQVDYTYGNQKTKVTSQIPDASGTYNSSSTMLRIGIGLNYFITKTIAAEGLAYYERVSDNVWGYESVTPNYALGLKFYIFKNI